MMGRRAEECQRHEQRAQEDVRHPLPLTVVQVQLDSDGFFWPKFQKLWFCPSQQLFSRGHFRDWRPEVPMERLVS